VPVLVRLLRIAAAYACACLAAGFTLIPLLVALGWLEDRLSGAVSHMTPDAAVGIGQAVVGFLSIVALGSALIAVWAAPLAVVAIVLLEWRGGPSRGLGAALGAGNGLASSLWLGEAPSLVGPVCIVLGGAVAGWTYAAARFDWLAPRPPALRPA
jgi:hypothetical protein